MTTRMGTNWIEVSQQYDFPFRVWLVHITAYFFDVELNDQFLADQDKTSHHIKHTFLNFNLIEENKYTSFQIEDSFFTFNHSENQLEYEGT